MNDARGAEIAEALVEAVKAGGALALRAFTDRSFEIEQKPDGTPVTSADLEVEKEVRARLADRLPDVPAVGEETVDGFTAGGAFVAIDPIDGTSNFIRGVPFFGVTAAYIEEGTVQAGVVLDPVHSLTYRAVREAGAFCNGERLEAPAGASNLTRATIAMSTESLPSRLQGNFLTQLTARVDRHQSIRSVALEIVGLAAGRIDAALFNRVAVWDIGAAALIVEEAGAHWTDLSGARPTFDDPGSLHSFCGALDPALLEELLALARS